MDHVRLLMMLGGVPTFSFSSYLYHLLTHFMHPLSQLWRQVRIEPSTAWISYHARLCHPCHL